jgi:2-(1,2-epoxy-1,2-dihydrophenyl)acetyl-CoA isomerase
MTLTCRQIDASEALQWGLVTRVVEAGELVGVALETAEAIAALPPRSIRLNKRLIMQSLDVTLPVSLELSAAFQAIVQNTADQKEAVAALLDKRTPHFAGR